MTARKRKTEFMWECICGHTEYGMHPPEDCSKCFRVGKFELVPEDEVEEREAERVLAIKENDEEEDENAY